MNIDLPALKNRGAAIYRDFTVGQRATLAVAALGVLVGGYLFMQWAAAPAWQPLYTNLEADDAADITTELDSMGVAYELRDGGTTIVVDSADVYSTRIELSAQGLPRVGGEGWNLLDEQGLTTSEFRQRVDFQRAMEGELASTIASIDAVDTATVHLVIPEDDLFAADDVHASASVLVNPAGDAALTASQVQAIVHMVASSVEGMVPEYVTVADTSGRVLSAPGQDGLDVAAGEQRVAQRAAYEHAVSQSIESLLGPVAGVGNTRVVVSADLDFDQRESVSETFAEPETSPVVSEQTTEEEYTGAGQPVGGVLGPDATPINADGGTGDYARNDATRTFAVGKVTEQVKAAPGSVERLSVAVLVNEDADVDTAAVTELVNAAAGLLPERGDTLQVTAMPFEQVDPDALAEGTSSQDAGDDLVITLARTAGVVLLVAGVLFLAYRSARRSSLAKYPVAIPIPSSEDAAGVLAEAAAELEAAGVDPERLQLEPSEPPRHVVLQDQIGDLIDRQPEDVAAVLRTWLADRRT